MAVNIDTVYQKVLAIANKEQRGYITPQQFNLFADKAQKEIIDQYFYDINQFSRLHGNDTEYSDMLELLDEKLGALKSSSTQTLSNGSFSLSSDVYRIGSIIVKDSNVEVEPINYNEHKLRNLSPLTKPILKRPVYINKGNKINIYPNTITDVFLSYIKVPDKPTWGYVVVGDKPLYNPDTSENFKLHPIEESELVYRILIFSGVSIEKPGLTQIAASLETAKVQQEKI
tara:strand:+ start:246 stop:932 length:687 start_codon:yes stop_codon:yes gene_type:complete